MRHGRPAHSCSSLLRTFSSSSQLVDLLLVSSVTKTLSRSGTHRLDPQSIPLSDSLVVQILRKPFLDPSKKLAFFRWCRLNFKHSASAYSHMFRSVCRAGNLNEVPDLLNSMKEDAVVVDSDTFKLLLDAFIRLDRFDSALETLDHMEELGATVNAQMYCSVLLALVRKNQVHLALSIFFKLVDVLYCNGNSVGDVSLLDSVACNELLIALRRRDMRVEFKNVFDKLRDKGFELNTWGYNISIHAFGIWGDLDTSLSLFEEMKEKSSDSGSFGPDLCTFNSLIQVLCWVGKLKDALIVWEELKVSGFEPDLTTYRIIILGCCKSYHIDDATKIFSEMQYNGLMPDTRVYNSLIDGLFKARKVTEACGLFEKMVRDGTKASCWTHNILIDGLFKNGRVEAAYTLFCDLKKKGHFVDGVTYSIVVIQLCREGQLEKALNLVEEMEARGFTVDLVTITSILIGFHKHGQWDKINRLMKHVRDGNLVPSILEWQANVEALMKNPQSQREDYTELFPSKGDFSDVMNLIGSVLDVNLSSEEGGCTEDKKSAADTDPWSSSPYLDQLANQVKSTARSSRLFTLSGGQRVQANRMGSFDIDMVNTFLSIFLAKGKLSLACKLFEIFTDMGVDPRSYTYNSMMSSFVKKGYFNQAWGVLSEMGEKICPADIATYNVIIQGLGKMGRVDIASTAVDKLTEQGGYVNIVMYNTLINQLGKAGRIDEVNMLFNQMKASGINPDVVTFNTLIEVHSKAGILKDAHKFLKMMLDSGCMPNEVTDNILDFLANEMARTRHQKASMKHNNDDDS